MTSPSFKFPTLLKWNLLKDLPYLNYISMKIPVDVFQVIILNFKEAYHRGETHET